MRAGRLRHRLVLQSKVDPESTSPVSRDAYGGVTVAYTNEATVWGAIEPLSGRELFAQQQIQAEARVRIVLRYRSDIDETWRIKDGDGLYYNVLDVMNENSRDRQLILLCRQGISEDTGTEPANVVNSGVLVVNSGTQVVYTS